jgi:hypothetical protein
MTSRLRRRRLLGRLVTMMALVSMCAILPAAGQTLGDAAREAQARRKTVKSPGKVYTNDSLRSEPPPAQSTPAPPPTTTATPPSQSGVAPGEDKSKAADQSSGKDEATWRERVKAERDALARAETFAAALQSQINGLYAEFTACQAPPQCNQISANRQKSIAELDRVKKEVETHTKNIADIQEEARKDGVPAGWVR